MRGCLRREEHIIANDVGIAQKFGERLVGVMFKSEMNTQEGLYIPNCRQVHTMFVRFDLDLVWVNKQLEVVKIVNRMKKWRLSSIVFKAYGVIELAPGVIEANSLQIGDKLTLESK